jgi:hypothetical protein
LYWNKEKEPSREMREERRYIDKETPKESIQQREEIQGPGVREDIHRRNLLMENQIGQVEDSTLGKIK